MFNPFLMAFEWQMAAMQAWLRAMSCTATHCAHIAALPEELLNHPDHHRHHDVLYRGPDLEDHYGRRAHDVDVERV